LEHLNKIITWDAKKLKKIAKYRKLYEHKIAYEEKLERKKVIAIEKNPKLNKHLKSEFK